MIVLMATVILYQTWVIKDSCETDQHVFAAFILFSAFVTLLVFPVMLLGIHAIVRAEERFLAEHEDRAILRHLDRDARIAQQLAAFQFAGDAGGEHRGAAHRLPRAGKRPWGFQNSTAAMRT